MKHIFKLGSRLPTSVTDVFDAESHNSTIRICIIICIHTAELRLTQVLSRLSQIQVTGI